MAIVKCIHSFSFVYLKELLPVPRGVFFVEDFLPQNLRLLAVEFTDVLGEKFALATKRVEGQKVT